MLLLNVLGALTCRWEGSPRPRMLAVKMPHGHCPRGDLYYLLSIYLLYIICGMCGMCCIWTPGFGVRWGGMSPFKTQRMYPTVYLLQHRTQ